MASILGLSPAVNHFRTAGLLLPCQIWKNLVHVMSWTVLATSAVPPTVHSWMHWEACNASQLHFPNKHHGHLCRPSRNQPPSWFLKQAISRILFWLSVFCPMKMIFPMKWPWPPSGGRRRDGSSLRSVPCVSTPTTTCQRVRKCRGNNVPMVEDWPRGTRVSQVEEGRRVVWLATLLSVFSPLSQQALVLHSPSSPLCVIHSVKWWHKHRHSPQSRAHLRLRTLSTSFTSCRANSHLCLALCLLPTQYCPARWCHHHLPHRLLPPSLPLPYNHQPPCNPPPPCNHQPPHPYLHLLRLAQHQPHFCSPKPTLRVTCVAVSWLCLRIYPKQLVSYHCECFS